MGDIGGARAGGRDRRQGPGAGMVKEAGIGVGGGGQGGGAGGRDRRWGRMPG